MANEQDDALTVARWCWPDRHWVKWGDGSQAYEVTGRLDAGGNPIGACNWWPRDDFERDSIAEAEQVVLARGLADQYGRALTAQIVSGGDIDYGGDQAAFFRELPDGVRAAMLATAPLASRLRALARVARENPKWSGHPVDVDQHKEAKP